MVLQCMLCPPIGQLENVISKPMDLSASTSFCRVVQFGSGISGSVSCHSFGLPGALLKSNLCTPLREVCEVCSGRRDLGGGRGPYKQDQSVQFRCMAQRFGSYRVRQVGHQSPSALSHLKVIHLDLRLWRGTSERLARSCIPVARGLRGYQQDYNADQNKDFARDVQFPGNSRDRLLHGSLRRTTRFRRDAVRKGQEWQEYEVAVQKKDLTKALEVLDSLNTFESDNGNLPADLSSNSAQDLKLFQGTFSRKQPPDFLRILDACEKTSDLAQVGKAYDWLEAKGVLPNFGKVKPVADDGERLITDAVLMKSIGLKASQLSPKKWGLSGESAIVLPVAIAVFSWLISSGVELRPVAGIFLALGIYDAVYLGGTGFSQFLSMWLPYQERVLVHEAGHVVVAYLLGCPVRGVVLTPGQAMKVGIQGQAGTQFWDKVLDEELSRNRLTGATIDRYSIVLFGGIAAEALIYGEADGGEGDENQFKSIVSQLQPGWSPSRMSNQARWAVLQAFKILRENRKAHRVVVDALREEASLGSLVRAIELALEE